MDEKFEIVNVPKRILNTLLTALSAGVVPRNGAAYIAIGRGQEIASILHDLDAVREGSAACRFLIGRYGSGKSFLIQLIRSYALDRDFLTMDTDLAPERRLSGVGGVATYRELLKNLASKSIPEGGALPSVLSRHFIKLKTELIAEGILPESKNFEEKLKQKVYAAISELEGDVGGFDFSTVLCAYYEASIHDDNDKKNACLRWLRGEYATKTEAKNALGFSVSTVVSDENWYSFIKIFARFAKLLGYTGLLIFIDECVNLYKIPNRISRESNYEKILAIFNDVLQGKAKDMAVFFGGTPQFLEDPRRGLYSYEALKSRLEDSRFLDLGYQNLSSPVIRLRRLSDNELLALVYRLTKLFMQKENLQEAPITDSQIEAFLRTALSRAGADEMITPREIIRDYLTLLAILRDNPNALFEDLLSRPVANAPTGSTNQHEGAHISKIQLSDIEI